MTALFAVFGTGILASLSPCVYPLIPITLGFFGTQADGQRKTGVLAYAAGQILSFIVLGSLAVMAGEVLGFTSESPAVRASVGVILLAASLISFSGRLPGFLSRIQLPGLGSSVPGAFGAFALGAGSALVASPCTSPLLAGVLALMASTATLGQGLLLMTSYAAGFSFLFVLLGLGALNLKRLPRAGRWMQRLHQVGAAALGLTGLYFLARALTG